jgi:hypothetical protein
MSRRHALASVKLKENITRGEARELTLLIEKLAEPECVEQAKKHYSGVIVEYDDAHNCEPALFYIP